ncbi:MAG: hypothetical protein NVS9B15_02440 [Acidobacteriaceae bacterium]
MHNQPKYIPMRSSAFFPDGSSARQPVLGTVARGHLNADTYFYTGKINGQDGTMLPFTVNKIVLERGQERFNIYCTPCHSRVGDGNGMIVQRGYRRAASFHDPRLLASPVGHFFDVITNGWGAMPDYAAQIEPQDRWAIAAYIRALQLSQNATIDDVPPDQRANVKTRSQIEQELAGGEAGMRERNLGTGEGATAARQGSSNVGPASQTKGGTSSNDINRDVNEQSGGQDIHSAQRDPQGQSGHPQGGDYPSNVSPRGSKGGEPEQHSLPQGVPQSGSTQTPQEGQAKPQGESQGPK